MNRRSVIGSLGAVFASALSVNNLLIPKRANAKTWASHRVVKDGTINPREVKINLKPVMTNLIHTDVWEGPCR